MGNRLGHERIVISVGGSLIVPNGGINIPFLMKLNEFIRKQLAKNPKRQFFLVIGGGETARHYIEAGKEVVGHDLVNEDLDWLGIHSTRLNAHLMRTIFQDIAYPRLIDDYTIIQKVTEPVIIAAGWRPGWSTDYCATLLCEDYHVATALNLSNVSKLYDRDPNKFPDAQPIDKITWDKFRSIVGDKWVPGSHVPFDPIAAKKAQELGIRVVIMSGSDFENIEKYLGGKEFVGTVIE